MRLQLRHFAALSLLFCLIASLPAFAQSQATTGVIQGTVDDPSGAVLPGAAVVARNVDTNFTRELKTDNEGRFVFLALPPGRYTLTVTPSSGGFAVLEQSNVNVTVGKSISLNLRMKVAQGSEKVFVTDTPLIDAAKTESSTTLDQQAVSATPVLGRKFEDLLTLTPGVSISQGPDGDEINFNGQRGIFNNISLDGGDYNNGFFGEQMGGQRAAADITLDAIGEFQVVASGASAEFGRTAGGVVNVVTKSGTNNVHGSLFHYQRLQSLTSNTSDGKPLQDFHREQFGGTIGGPIKKDKQFFFFAFEQILANLSRANLGDQLGPTACPVQNPTILADEALLKPVSQGGNADCQRIALVNFYSASPFGLNEGAPVEKPIRNSNLLGKWDWNVNSANKISASYNFNYSKNRNQTFDVNTYGPSANGTEGPSKIQAVNVNFFSTVSSTKLNELHFTYGREDRPRGANDLLTPDTGIGSDFGAGQTNQFAFRFGNPFFLQPNVDELFWRTQFKDSFAVVKGAHNFKVGGEWMHSKNSQVFRGFFQGRYIFDSVNGFLRYASPAGPGGFGPQTIYCSGAGGAFQYATATCPAGFTNTGGPLLLFLQAAALNGPATDATGFSAVTNEDFAVFAQDRWQITPRFTLSYGLRWEAQTLPDPVIDPSNTAYGVLLSNPAFPSNGKLPSQWKQFQPRLGIAWDITGQGKSVFRATAGIFNAHQNMLSQVGSITTNGVQQQTLASGSFVPNPPPYPTIITTGITAGSAPGVRVFDRDYHNPRIYTYNMQFEQEIVSNLSAYVDFSWSKGVYLTNFLDYNGHGRNLFPGTLGETMVTSSRAHSDYKGVTFGARKRLSNNLQFEANYVYAKDYDNDSNERDPFNDFSGPADAGCSQSSLAACFPLYKDWARSNRDIRHKFNMYLTGYLPWKFEGNIRFQARSAQPNATPRTVIAGVTTPRNFEEKENEYSSFDWRISRPFKFNERYELIPTFEMFNTFNSANNVNTLSAPPLFDFNGFLRVGVGDPRQAQFALRFRF
jgi:hypothetical protein